MIQPITTFVNICVSRDANAAPLMPYSGIKNAFNTTLAVAPDKLIIHSYFCLPSLKIQTSLTDPMYENVVYQTTILSALTAPPYSLPYNIVTMSFANKVINPL